MLNYIVQIFILITLYAVTKYTLQNVIKTKPRIKNPFFVILIIITLITYVLLGRSYYIQNNVEGLEAWNTAIRISGRTIIIIILNLITRCIIFYTKKINGSEFLICFFMNLSAVCTYLMVIVDRI